MIVPGAVVWLALAAAILIWLGLVAGSSGRLIGPIRVARWLLGSWVSRAMVLLAWGGAGWHIFCQRP
jgi:hypothetical protein